MVSGMESKQYQKNRGDVEISLMTYKDNGQFVSICCGVINIGGETVDAGIGMDEYGLFHNYFGERKEDVDDVLMLVQRALVKDYGLEFSERTQAEDAITPPEEEPQNEEA